MLVNLSGTCQLLFGILFIVSGLHTAAASEGVKTWEYVLIGPPQSPLHSLVAIGQELCARGHNVTVLSFGERGRKKTEKYSPACPLRYLSLGELSLSEDEEQLKLMPEVAQIQNNTFKVIQTIMGRLGSIFTEPMKAGLERILFKEKLIKPDFAVLSVPLGLLPSILGKYGIDYAINIPTIAAPPIVPMTSSYIPMPLHDVSLYSTTFVDRMLIQGFQWTVYVVRNVASGLFGFKFSFFPDLDPESWHRRLVLLNSFPGYDYPQSFPPLVQYIGPIINTTMLEKLPSDIQDFLDNPSDLPIVYVSFGTMAYLTPERVSAMVNTLTSNKWRVLWALAKHQQKGLPAQLPPTFKVHHWVSTPSALAHPKVAAFISHCGGNSVAESMAFGKPIIGYPQFGDQLANCRRVADVGAGRTRQVASWVQADDVREVLGNPDFAKKAQRLSRIFKVYGGVQKAADLLQLGAQGDLGALVLPTETSWKNWFQLGGWEFFLVIGTIFQIVLFLSLYFCKCFVQRISAPKVSKVKQL